MTPFLSRLFQENKMESIVYAEPYAGGAGAAINLLISNTVERVLINDANIGIYSFWKAVKENNDRLCDWIMNKPVDLDEWNRWHRFFRESKEPSFELGYSTFFLSRTNRSGILNAGPIGGNSSEKQAAAKYKIDCRYNREVLCDKIHRIGDFRNQIFVSNLDALVFLANNNNTPNLFVYLDPPYYNQGKSLYMSYYNPEDHIALANFLSREARFEWLMSYDFVDEICDIYKDFDLYHYSLNYSAREARKGKELLAHSAGIRVPKDMSIVNTSLISRL